MKQIINVTDIIGYLYCPRKIYLKLVKGIKEKPTKPMISGFLKHKVFDIFNKNEQAIVSSIKQNFAKEEILALYKTHLTNIIKNIAETYKNMINKFDINIQDFSNDVFKFMEKEFSLRADSIKKTLEKGFLGKELWRELKPKYLTEFQIISEELGLKGRIDRIKFEDKILPYEIKTRQEIYESDRIQLAAYSLLLENEFRKKIEKGIIETAKKQEEIELSQELKQQVLEIADKIREMKTKPEFNSNFVKCKACRLRKDCFEF